MTLSRQFHRLELRRQDHFQQFDVVGIIHDQMLDPRRLGPGAALLHQGLALPFHVGLHPALEHVDHLEFDVVEMQLRHFGRIARPDQPDHMRLRQAVGGVGDAEVAIMRVAAQAVGDKILVAMMADGDALLRRRAFTAAGARAPCGLSFFALIDLAADLRAGCFCAAAIFSARRFGPRPAMSASAWPSTFSLSV